MLGSHTSPGLIEDILLPAYWSPRTTFETNFQERITPVSDRWKLASLSDVGSAAMTQELDQLNRVLPVVVGKVDILVIGNEPFIETEPP